MKINTIRRIVQLTLFIIIVYGGLIFSQVLDIEAPSKSRGNEYEKNLIDAHLPVRTCRYIEPKPTLFESCGLRYLLQRPLYFDWSAISLYVLIILGLCFLLGRFMCGWMCPLGFISDVLDFIRQKLKISRITLPRWVKILLKNWRYSFLAFLILISLVLITPLAHGFFMNKSFESVICQVCPSRIILPLLQGTFIKPSFMNAATSFFSTLSLIFLGIYLCGVIITRPWCRICPNGTFTSLFNRGALLTKEKDTRKCTKCGICKRVCPFTNDHVLDEKKKTNVNHPNCIMCFNCIGYCPEKKCLNVKLFNFKFLESKYNTKVINTNTTKQKK